MVFSERACLLWMGDMRLSKQLFEKEVRGGKGRGKAHEKDNTPPNIHLTVDKQDMGDRLGITYKETQSMLG